MDTGWSWSGVPAWQRFKVGDPSMAALPKYLNKSFARQRWLLLLFCPALFVVLQMEFICYLADGSGRRVLKPDLHRHFPDNVRGFRHPHQLKRVHLILNIKIVHRIYRTSDNGKIVDNATLVFRLPILFTELHRDGQLYFKMGITVLLALIRSSFLLLQNPDRQRASGNDKLYKDIWSPGF